MLEGHIKNVRWTKGDKKTLINLQPVVANIGLILFSG